MVGAIEETSLEQAQRLFDVNFFGAVRMTQAVLPAMRAQRSGRIVFISSIVGFLPAPFMGFYAASKHALEGLAESLDHETRTLGIRAALVEPAWTRTQLEHNGATADNPIEDYAAARDRARKGVRESTLAGDDPSLVAEAAFEGSALAHARSAEDLLRGYLSKAHRDAPAAGCPIPALVSDMARQPAAVRSAYASGVRDALARIRELVPGANSRTRLALVAG